MTWIVPWFLFGQLFISSKKLEYFQHLPHIAESLASLWAKVPWKQMALKRFIRIEMRLKRNEASQGSLVAAYYFTQVLKGISAL